MSEDHGKLSTSEVVWEQLANLMTNKTLNNAKATDALQAAVKDDSGLTRLSKIISERHLGTSKIAFLMSVCQLSDPETGVFKDLNHAVKAKMLAAASKLASADSTPCWALFWLRYHYGDRDVPNDVRDRLLRMRAKYRKPELVAEHLGKILIETGYDNFRWNQLFDIVLKNTSEPSDQADIQNIRVALNADPKIKNIPPAVISEEVDTVDRATLPQTHTEDVILPVRIESEKLTIPATPHTSSSSVEKQSKKQPSKPAIVETFVSLAEFTRVVGDVTRRLESLEADKQLRGELDKMTAERDAWKLAAGQTEKNHRDAVELAVRSRNELHEQLAVARAEVNRLTELDVSASKRIEEAERRADQNVHDARRETETAVSEFRYKLGQELGRLVMDVSETDAPITQEIAQIYLERLVVIRSTLRDYGIRVD